MSDETPVNGLIESLHNPSLYNHPVTGFELIETHISWVILTGTFAYKIKKPVNYGFLDFSTLDSRRHFCFRELLLNKRLAEKLYVDVVTITGSATSPQLGGDGEPIEYALRMRQFDQGDLFDRRQAGGQLTPPLLAALARKIADFHQRLPPLDDDSALGSGPEVFAAMAENFDQIRPRLSDSDAIGRLDMLENWTRKQFEAHRERIDQRRRQGLVRECHGDLHLANITLFEGEVTIFDCIEFNDTFRWIDVVNDLAFLLMDLEFRGEESLANLVLNSYLEYRDDYTGVTLLPLYKTYRAMVRAKVSILTLDNPALTAADRARLWSAYQNYTALAERYTRQTLPCLVATTGLSASGKSHVSARLSGALGLIRLRSDVERKRLFGLAPLDSSDSAPGRDLYTPEASSRTYQRLATIAGQLLAVGLSVIVDAACLKQEERQLFARVASRQGAPFALVHCEAPESQRREWIRKRSGDPSEATEALITIQNSWFEPLTESESESVITVRTARSQSLEQATQRVQRYLEIQRLEAHLARNAGVTGA
ncbi:MAG: AAA family ATPase [Porticoccaceae bacterium]